VVPSNYTIAVIYGAGLNRAIEAGLPRASVARKISGSNPAFCNFLLFADVIIFFEIMMSDLGLNIAKK